MAAVLRQHYEAVNKGDVAAVMATFTDDAVLRRGPLCPAAKPCVDKAAIQKEIEFEVRSQETRYDLSDIQASGETATARVERRGTPFGEAGVERGVEKHTVSFRGDKIARFFIENDLSDPQTAVFEAFVRVSRFSVRHTDPLNRGDVAGALEPFADDAVFEGFGLCAPVRCLGKAAIQKEIDRQVADRTSITLIRGQARVAGDTITGRIELRSDPIKAAGVERIVASRTLVVKGDKITLYRYALDATDAQTATYINSARLSGILRQHYDAINRGDAAAAFAVFTEDAIAVRGAGCPLFAPCKGTAILDTLKLEVGNEARFALLNFQLAGDEGTGRIEFRAVVTRNVGVDRVIWNVKATFRGDKIARLVHELDVSDPQTAGFSNFQRVVQAINASVFALNRGEVTGAIAPFSDDAVFEGWGLCAAAPCQGKAAIQKEMEREVADKLNILGVPGAARITGNTVTSRAELRSDSIKAAGVERIVVFTTHVVKGDKYTSLLFELDNTDPQTATYLKSQAR